MEEKSPLDLNVSILTRNDTAANWESVNPVLGKGELALEIDTRKFKFGDGVTPYQDLWYSGSNSVVTDRNPNPNDLDYDVGTLWVNNSPNNNRVYILTSKNSYNAIWYKICMGSVIAASLETARDITINGDVVENVKSFDGTKDVTFTLELNASGVTPGTYSKVTVNSKGLVTDYASLTVNDIPPIPSSKVTGLGVAATAPVGNAGGCIPMLDVYGKLPSSVLPALAISETFTVGSEAAMLVMNAQRGDIAIRTDINKTFILTADDPSTLSNWKELKTPDCKVSSVNSKTGAVSLNTDDINEGSANKYWTDSRFDTRFGGKSVNDLQDSSGLIRSTDKLILNCGNAEGV